MTDIVERLREHRTMSQFKDISDLIARLNGERNEAADEIECLREVLRKWDALIQYQYNGSREAMSALQECAFETDAILKEYALGEKE